MIAMELTGEPNVILKLMTASFYLIGLCLILVAFYLLGARRAKQTKPTILIPITLIFMVFGFVEFKLSGNIWATLFVGILVLPYCIYLLGTCKANPTKNTIWLPIVLIVIGLVLLILPSLIVPYQQTQVGPW